MDLGINKKTALVMAGGGGLGGAIAHALSKEGCSVAVADVNLEAAESVAAAIRASGGTAGAMQWDLSRTEHHAERLGVLEKKFGPVDILINNSGGPRPASTDQVSDEQWRGYFDSMVLSLVSLTRPIAEGMKSRGWGRIITSTSSGVVAPIPNLAASNALRLALVGWSKSLAGEIARHGVTVNVTVPGRIATQRIVDLDHAKATAAGSTPEEVSANSIASIPIGRYGNPNEYADAITFLASARASYITGTVIRVDGGLISSI
ncbi:MAG: SDR family oxidoreductase [Comamonadaceae bacterium]|nr:SDR family oxidoreductase [Comamonadaceae bacterium]